MVDVWQRCHGDNHIHSMAVEAWRVQVEGNNSTRKLVDSLYSQQLLEEMIDSLKPQISGDRSDLLDLLFKPFRSPPLKYGSRFGGVYERSLWYGSMSVETALCESAYYRLVFLDGTSAEINHSVTYCLSFSVNVNINRGVDLTSPPFKKHRKNISSPADYKISQSLGAAMRNESVDGFKYYSARDKLEGVNIGLFASDVFGDNAMSDSIASWECYVTRNSVEYYRHGPKGNERISFLASNFYVNKKLPVPAC